MLLVSAQLDLDQPQGWQDPVDKTWSEPPDIDMTDDNVRLHKAQLASVHVVAQLLTLICLQGMTPLHHACKNGRSVQLSSPLSPCLRLTFVSVTAIVTIRHEAAVALLHYPKSATSRAASFDLVDNRGAALAITQSIDDSETCVGFAGRTALHYAAEGGSLAIVREVGSKHVFQLGRVETSETIRCTIDNSVTGIPRQCTSSHPYTHFTPPNMHAIAVVHGGGRPRSRRRLQNPAFAMLEKVCSCDSSSAAFCWFRTLSTALAPLDRTETKERTSN